MDYISYFSIVYLALQEKVSHFVQLKYFIYRKMQYYMLIYFLKFFKDACKIIQLFFGAFNTFFLKFITKDLIQDIIIYYLYLGMQQLIKQKICCSEIVDYWHKQIIYLNFTTEFIKIREQKFIKYYYFELQDLHYLNASYDQERFANWAEGQTN